MIHVLTLSWNGAGHLTNLYPGLTNNLVKTNQQYRWHIKSNGCTDGTEALVKSWNDDSVVLHRYPDNKMNFSEGCNYLYDKLTLAQNDYVLLLNNDVVFNDAVSLSGMLKLLNNPSVGAVAPFMKFKDSDTIQYAGTVFENRHGLPLHFKSGGKITKSEKKNRSFQCLNGACCLITSATAQDICRYRQASLFDPKYVWAFDDVDLTLVISKVLKKQCILFGGSDMSHDESSSLKKNPVNKLFLTSNVNHFHSKWKNRYDIDQSTYERNQEFGLFK